MIKASDMAIPIFKIAEKCNLIMCQKEESQKCLLNGSNKNHMNTDVGA